MTIIWPIFPEIWSVTDRICCHFGPFFAFLYSLTTRKINILKKWTPPRDIIILHMCTINDNNYMMHDSWNMKHDNKNFCHFGPFFALLPPLTQKIKILKNWKKLLEISSFTQVYQKSWSYMLYCSLDIPCNKFNYFPFWTIFCPFIPASIWYATSIVRMRICAVAILQYFACENWSQGNWFF